MDNTNTTTQSKTFDPLTHPIPDLGVGTRLESFFADPSPQGRRERQAVAFILDALAACGFTPNGGEVLDGFGGEECGKAHDTKSAMEAIFNLDEARVYMRDTEGRDVGHIYFVRGNSPEEVVSDWSWMKVQADEPKGFKATLDRLTRCLWDGRVFEVDPKPEPTTCKHGYTGPHHRIAGEECAGPWTVG